MQLYPLIIAVVLIVSGVIWQRSTTKTIPGGQDVVASVPTQTPPTTDLTINPTQSLKPELTQTQDSPTQKPASTSPPQKPTASTPIEFYYPNAEKIPGTTNQYTTNDSPDTVANWYKDQFAKKQFSTKTSIYTRVNGEQKILLSVAKDREHISVTITRENGENLTHITLEL